MLNKEWDQSLARLALTCVASEVPLYDHEKRLVAVATAGCFSMLSRMSTS